MDDAEAHGQLADAIVAYVEYMSTRPGERQVLLGHFQTTERKAAFMQFLDWFELKDVEDKIGQI